MYKGSYSDWLAGLSHFKTKNIISSICVHIDGKMITNIVKSISSDHALYVRRNLFSVWSEEIFVTIFVIIFLPVCTKINEMIFFVQND